MGSHGAARFGGSAERFICRVAAALLCCVLPASPAAARSSGESRLASDAPEAWAMFFYASAASFAGVGTPRQRELWSVEAFLDLGDIPHLGPDERTVGFDGTKQEDLNKAPLYGRPGLTLGLPWDVSFSIGYIPPVKVFGLRANLVSMAIERPLLQHGPWSSGLRVHTQFGQVRGAYTCPGRVLKFEPGSDGNPYGCEQESNDTAIQRTLGFEMSGSYRIDSLYRAEPYLILGANYLNTEFHVHGLEFGEKDRTRLAADTWALSLGGGITIPVGDRVHLGLGVQYVPLYVAQPPDPRSESDSMIQVRGEISYRLR